MSIEFEARREMRQVLHYFQLSRFRVSIVCENGRVVRVDYTSKWYWWLRPNEKRLMDTRINGLMMLQKVIDMETNYGKD